MERGRTSDNLFQAPPVKHTTARANFEDTYAPKKKSLRSEFNLIKKPSAFAFDGGLAVNLPLVIQAMPVSVATMADVGAAVAAGPPVGGLAAAQAALMAHINAVAAAQTAQLNAQAVQLNAHTAQLNALAGQVGAVQASVDRVDNRINRLTNVVAVKYGDPLLPVCNAAGLAPPGFFPATVEAFHGLLSGQRNQLLTFYGLVPVGGAGSVQLNKRALADAIGFKM